MFPRDISSYLSNSDTEKTWSAFYDSWNDDPVHWSELSSSLHYWTNITKPKELLDHFHHFPHHGLLVCDHQDRATILHHITVISGKCYAFTGNKISTPPIEWIPNNKIHIQIAIPSSSLDSTNEPEIPGIMITQDQLPDSTPADASAPIDPKPIDFDNTKPKRRGRKITKRRDDNETGGTEDKFTDSFFIVHPCLLAKLLPLSKPFQPSEVQAVFDDFEQNIFDSGHYTKSEFDKIHSTHKHIAGFLNLCGTDTYHRSSIFALDEDTVEDVLQHLQINATALALTYDESKPAALAPPPPTEGRTTDDVLPSPSAQTTQHQTPVETADHPNPASANNDDRPSDIIITGSPTPTRQVQFTSPPTTHPDMPSAALPPTFPALFHNMPSTEPPTTTASPPPTVPIPTITDIASQIRDLTALAQTLLSTQASQHQHSVHQDLIIDNAMSRNNSPSKKQSLFDNLPPTVQLSIIRGSSSNHLDPEPTTPHQACLDLIATANRAKAASYLQSTLRDAGVRGSFQLGQLTRLLHSGPIWLSPNKPEGLTLFAVSPTPDDTDSSRDKEVILSLKACHDNHLDNEDATFLAKKGYFFPSDVNELEIMLTTFTTLCSIYFGPLALITQGMQSWVNHVTDQYDSYFSQCRDIPLFGTRLLYLIDLNIQQYLNKIKHRHIPLSTISAINVTDIFAQLQSQVVGRQLTVNLLPELLDDRSKLLNNKRNRKSDEAPRPSKFPRHDDPKPDNDFRTRSSPTNKAPTNNIEAAINHRINPKWQISSHHNFYEVFVRNRDNKPPTHNNTPFCVQFHVCGKCNRGPTCKFLHSDPRDLNLDKHFDEFVARAYAPKS